MSPALLILTAPRCQPFGEDTSQMMWAFFVCFFEREASERVEMLLCCFFFFWSGEGDAGVLSFKQAAFFLFCYSLLPSKKKK